MTVLNVSDLGITSLQGIEYFPALASLDCSNNALTSLDLSHNRALTQLFCAGNKLTELDVRRCPALTALVGLNNKVSIGDYTGYMTMHEDGYQIDMTVDHDVIVLAEFDPVISYDIDLDGRITPNDAAEIITLPETAAAILRYITGLTD